jgi:predicted regulator of Ras-like GTPase activity (Roadblock/LC7/MglB family)
MATAATATATAQRTEAALRALAATPGLHGVILASRDGLPVLAQWPQPQEVDTFVAMQATALGAAEIAVSTGATHRTVSMIVNDGATRHVVTGVSRDFFVIVWTEKTIPVEQVLDAIGEFGAAMGG